MKNLTILELNEFNQDYLFEIGNKYNLNSIKTLQSFYKIITTTKDKEEHKNLDPWVQWVSVHTGKDSSEHKIFELGGSKDLNYKQIWDHLTENNISCGVFGAMNTKFNKTTSPKFFIPDPWNMSETCKPNELNDFLALPRYYSNEYSFQKYKLFLNF